MSDREGGCTYHIPTHVFVEVSLVSEPPIDLRDHIVVLHLWVRPIRLVHMAITAFNYK
jgi:hypothetical protein